MRLVVAVVTLMVELDRDRTGQKRDAHLLSRFSEDHCRMALSNLWCILGLCKTVSVKICSPRSLQYCQFLPRVLVTSCLPDWKSFLMRNEKYRIQIEERRPQDILSHPFSQTVENTERRYRLIVYTTNASTH